MHSEIYKENLQNELNKVSEWEQAIILHMDGTFLATKNCEPETLDTFAFLKAFDERETAITQGLFFDKKHFSIHHWRPPFLFGRQGHPIQSQGLAMLKGVAKTNEEPVILVVTYVLPYVAPYIFEKMLQFFVTHLGQVTLSNPSETFRNI